MSNTYQPESLHPYIMNDRLKKATGSGGISNIPIASADTVGGIMIGGSANPITITGSGNASVRKATSELLGVVKAGDGVSVDEDGAISGVAYSTTEHKTGRKWIDDKDIYEKTFQYTPTSAESHIELNTSMDAVISIIGTLHDETSNNYFDVNGYLTSSTFMYAYVNTNDSKLMYRIPNNLVNMAHTVTIQYTKPTTP